MLSLIFFFWILVIQIFELFLEIIQVMGNEGPVWLSELPLSNLLDGASCIVDLNFSRTAPTSRLNSFDFYTVYKDTFELSIHRNIVINKLSEKFFKFFVIFLLLFIASFFDFLFYFFLSKVNNVFLPIFDQISRSCKLFQCFEIELIQLFKIFLVIDQTLSPTLVAFILA